MLFKDYKIGGFAAVIYTFSYNSSVQFRACRSM